ncbi:hypothetical protein [Methanorbis rubei]|uniref:Uncharacterized protein n=1 Tax=Methanorbis rubei TaxID=3028300 RepID=A0AAE4MGW6_9EURY|nr:hypothetical protein [Methanocorpusculaceae archaeon Cs1]
MNTLAKITAVLFALTLLVMPIAAVETEGEHGIFVVSTDADHPIAYLKYIPLDEHEKIPEHMELRPYFRDSDPEFVVIDAEDRPTDENMIMTEMTTLRPSTVSDNTAASVTYEYAAIP